MTTALQTIIKEAIDKNPLALKEEFSRELINRVGSLIEAKKAAMKEEEMEDGEEGSEEDGDNGNGSSSDENDEEDDLKEGFGTDSKFSYAVNVKGVDDKFYTKPFGRQMEDMAKVKVFMKDAKKTHVGAKGKSTMAAVKQWVKEAKPSQYYAKWQSDSSNYKDDSVEVYYV